jgi:hypothetical protein
VTSGARALAAVCGIACSLAVGSMAARQRSAVKDDLHVPGTGMVLKPGWKFLSYTGCGCLVPISWQPSFDEPLALGPDGSSLSIRKETIASWAAYKEQVRRSYGDVKAVHEDSERLLWFETGDAARVEHYIAAPSGPTVCVGVLDVHRSSVSNGTETVVVIARSIRLLPPNWPGELP